MPSIPWVTRSLMLFAVGAVCAFAVTVTWPQFDLQTAGVVLMAVGAFDFLLGVGLTAYENSLRAEAARTPVVRRAVPPAADPYGAGYDPDRTRVVRRDR